jgi:5-methylcytosine-specific restriction endonuclease McrA
MVKVLSGFHNRSHRQFSNPMPDNKQEMRRRNRVCTFCGITGVPLERGHVVPKSLYPDSRKTSRLQLITIPECPPAIADGQTMKSTSALSSYWPANRMIRLKSFGPPKPRRVSPTKMGSGGSWMFTNA